MRRIILACIVIFLTIALNAQTPVLNAKKVSTTITVDGNLNESSWEITNSATKLIVGTTTNNTIKFGVLWNAQYLYIGYTVTDATFFNDSPNDWDDDAVELYIDADNNGGTAYGVNDRQFAKGWNTTTIWEKNNKTTGVLHAWTATANGYSVELAIPWSNIAITNPAAGLTIGFDIASDDDDNGAARESQLMWAGDNDNWQYPRNFGDLLLVNATDTQAPTAPVNVIASAVTQSSLTLSWTASTDNVGVTGYDVYRNGVKITTASITTATYAVTGLSAATPYSFYVVAKDAAGNISVNSNTVNIITPDTQLPTAPTNLAATSITQGTLTLTWSASTDNVGVTGYNVFRNGIKITSAPITTTSYAITGLSAGSTYTFNIVAIDAAGNVSPNSNTLSVSTPDLQSPTAPTNLVAATISQSSLSLSWTAATDNVGVIGYDVYRDNIKINASPVNAITYTVNGLSANVSYSFFVIARDAASNLSASSNVVNFLVVDIQAPTAPGNLNGSAITQTSLDLNWTASTDNVAVTGYDIFQDGNKLNSSLVTTTSYAVSGLASGSAYNFSVVAYDAAANAATSATLKLTTLTPPDTTPPSAPGSLSFSNISYNSFVLNWSAATDNVGVTGYDVYLNGNKFNASNLTATVYTLTGLAPSTSYQVYVRAKDLAANFTNSDTIVVTTIIAPDTTAPSAPTNLTATTVTASSLTLLWTPSTDNLAVVGYNIFQGSTKINTSPIAANSFDVTNLVTATTYNFSVKALDAAGNISLTSNIVIVTTPDNQPPTAPSNLTSSGITSTSAILNWSASSDNTGVNGYDIYKNNVKLNTAIVTGLTYNVTGLIASTSYSFFAKAIDAAGNNSASSNTVTVNTAAVPTGCSGTGAINYQKWNNVTGSAVTNLTSIAGYPNNPSVSGTLTSFTIPTNTADNYGIRVYGYICPPTTGAYTFWISSDDNGELWLSTTSSAANKQKIAYHTSWTNQLEWNKFTTQKSVAITLTAGQVYYVEALMKEGTQGDHLEVGWAKPGQATTTPSEVIPGTNLLVQIPTVPDTQAPGAPVNLISSNITPSSVNLTWTAATDNIGVTGYDIYRNAVKINTANVTGTAYTATGLSASTTYSFTVKAKDAAGNVSVNSNTVSVTTLQTVPGTETFTQRTIIANQRMPHDLVYGPDNNIWYTERFAGKVSFVNPVTSVKTTVLSLGSKFVEVGGQDGLMGLALHPQFRQGKPYVYISYTYQSSSATVRSTRIERYTYDSVNKTLIQPVTILEGIPGSNDHNSARLAIGPDLKLYYSVGDMGAGQFDNINRTNNAQNANVLEGKILRLNTEIIGGSWIPADNPFTNTSGQRTAVYTLGHRNPQGLVWGNVNGTNILYSSEHGPYSDDEINIIEVGRNYGWPWVAGFCDGNYNGRTLGGFAVVSEQNNCTTLNVKEPIRSIFPSANPPQEGTDNMTWPSMAPSGTEFYGSTAIPGWQNSLLVSMLKSGTITRFKLSNDGKTIISDTINYFKGKGRFRDIVVSPDGLKLYVACDSSGSTSGPTGNVTATPANPGSILEFTYTPVGGGKGLNDLVNSKYTAAVKEDTKNLSIDVFPNPASAYIIVYNYVLDGRSVELVDMSGRSVRKQMINSLATRIETGNLGNGLYILKVIDTKGKAIRTEKIIIQH